MQPKLEKGVRKAKKAEGKIDEILADSEKRHGETIKQYEERIAKRDAVVIKKRVMLSLVNWQLWPQTQVLKRLKTNF